ncbi:STAS domain-containing protein [Streptomyces sp. LP05-1]|uniref:STAS domain-containing protein n=1 Tax=Streptomyces pyxinae TaxID=2970734 RepID=A0ABT2CH12_9ACTN|nr:STAS domain-containing protein [Streptomyces sp. LP05-1]MCS0636701.1 STAS domain-containing protein [Streptomyces sp. LP05-1]
MSRTPLSLTAERPDGATVAVALAGELDIETVGWLEPALDRLLTEDSGDELLVDMTAVTFCDSSGADLFVRLHRRCARSGTRLRLCRVPRWPGRVLRALGVDRDVPCSYA